MNLKAQLTPLKTKTITVRIVGNVDYVGVLTDVGDDWLELDPGGGSERALLPFANIVCIMHP